MAKTTKKSTTKGAKKPAGKGKSNTKAKKSAKVKAKVSKKVVKKPVKKEPVKKVVRVAEVKKQTSRVSEVKSFATKKQEAMALPKVPPQLNIFPALTQRPIAHKQTKVSSTPDDKTRYSDEELKEFESLILGKLEKAREEFRILKETLNRNNDAGTDATSGGNTKVLEDGAETAEKENLSQLAARQLKYITNLENALVRIKNRTYGICTVTGKLIPKERLIAVPHTTQSIEAKMMQQD